MGGGGVLGSRLFSGMAGWVDDPLARMFTTNPGGHGHGRCGGWGVGLLDVGETSQKAPIRGGRDGLPQSPRHVMCVVGSLDLCMQRIFSAGGVGAVG